MTVTSLTRSTPFGVFAAIAAPLASVLILVALRAAAPFPATNDHAYFLPASFALAQGEHLANPWMPEGFNHALDWHGFLQPWLVGALAHALGGGWRDVYLATGVLAASSVVAAAHAALRLGFGAWRVCGVSLLALALMLDSRSRPETLATLETIVLVLLLAAPRALASIPRAIGCGLVLASLLATHPVIFGLSGVGVAVFAGVALLDRAVPLRDVLRFALAATAAFLLAFPILAAFCFDGALGDWIMGIVRAAALIVNRQDADGALRYLGANRFLPGLGLGLLFLPIVAATAPEHRRPAAILLLLATPVYAFLVWRFAIRIPQSYYNFTGILVAAALIAGAATKAGSSGRLAANGVLATLALSACAGTCLWVAQSFMERSALLRTRETLAEAIAADRSAGLRICADTAALPALDDAALAHAVTTSIPFGGTPQPPDPQSCDVFYQLQSRSGEDWPLPVPGFKLAEQVRVAATAPTWLKGRPLHFAFARHVRI